MSSGDLAEPDNTAVRTALWRALHLTADRPPHVFEDEVGLRLAGPDGQWRQRPDMDPAGTAAFRAAIVARARRVEELVDEQAAQGVDQYLLLGAGLDSFAQRRPQPPGGLRVFEIDRPGPQQWKRNRLAELGYGVPDWLRLVPVDFERGEDWLEHLAAAGFDPRRRAVVASVGVSMYLTEDATRDVLRKVAGLAAGTTLAMTFLLPADLLDPADRAGLRTSSESADRAGTPFRSFYTPGRMLALARESGFREVAHLPGRVLAERWFTGRPDGLRPSSGEDFLLATV
ncbi:class I SAM-dependent methyltransferase [Kitasatospora phosalacinea]|uniref:class I SAM-dependent methyltransferase n=1 Tax=Kitasatospora phosalacinea TaxID=2065 RepID=UPI003657AD4D